MVNTTSSKFDELVQARVPRSLAKLVRAKARADGRSVASYLRRLMERDVGLLPPGAG